MISGPPISFNLMNHSLRLSEKWFRLGLWLVALIFAGFLIGLGSTVIANLPKVERQLREDDFIDRSAAAKARQMIQSAERDAGNAADALEQANLKLKVAQANAATGKEAFENWLSTRRATERPDQDNELLTRTRTLDQLQLAQRQALTAVQAQQQVALDARQTTQQARNQLNGLQEAAGVKLAAAARQQQLRVFGYRLALTLPLLVIAGLLWKKKRQSVYWPFVWGFVFFALFAFFVELVPYLPSYGGYVRYVVGIIVTALVGRQAIVALNRYLERQRLAETMPDLQRREELSYDSALTRLGKGVCPGCERSIDLKDQANDFCPHCGICVYNRCGKCTARKSAFSKFCHACGTSASERRQERAEQDQAT